MTTHDLASDYFKRCQIRLLALETLYQATAFPDVIRESQELMELLLKGYLRLYKIDPPKWHDVSQILEENKSIFSKEVQSHLNEICAFSKYLRRERENSFYGDDDLIPLDHYDQKSASDCLVKVKKYIQIFSVEFREKK